MTISTSNGSVTFTVNTAWVQPEHNEAVLALREARDAAIDELDGAYQTAKDEIDDQIHRLKAKADVLNDELNEAKYVITKEYTRAVKAARGQEDDDE